MEELLLAQMPLLYAVYARALEEFDARWAELEDILARAEKAVPDNLGPYYAAAQSLLEIGKDFRKFRN